MPQSAAGRIGTPCTGRGRAKERAWQFRIAELRVAAFGLVLAPLLVARARRGSRPAWSRHRLAAAATPGAASLAELKRFPSVEELPSGLPALVH